MDTVCGVHLCFEKGRPPWSWCYIPLALMSLPFLEVRCFLSLLFLLCRTLCLHPQKEIEMNSWDFPGGSVVKTLPCKWCGFDPWLGLSHNLTCLRVKKPK